MAQLQGFTLTVPLIKIDAERRLVIARAAREERDKSAEIMDYATAKPAFQKWSDSYSANQILGAEKSKGNVRVMHSRNVAGKVTDLSFNDDDKAIDVVLKIDDDNEWRKLLAGNYTGLSIGGGYAKKWKDGDLTRYTPDVREISLVDNPCMPSARIVELVKADGMSSQLELRGVVPGFAAAWAARPKSFSESWAARPVPPRTFGDLAKAFEEDKHPRDHGKFASRSGYDAAVQSGATAGGVVGGAAGVGVALAAEHGQKLFDQAKDRIRFGGDRGKAAYEMRRDRFKRRKIVADAHDARVAASDAATDPRTHELAGAIHRKVMEEAANDGRDMNQAKLDADKAAAQVRGARDKGGAGLRRGRKAATDTIKRHMANYLKDIVRDKKFRIYRGIGVRTALALTAAGALAGMVTGGAAADKSVQRSKGIARGKKSDGSFMSHTGDVLRSAAPGIALGGLGASMANSFSPWRPGANVPARAIGLAGAAGLGIGSYYGAKMVATERKDAALIGARKKAS